MFYFEVSKLDDKIEELTLLLMYLSAWEEDSYVANDEGQVKETKVKTCWKGYSFDVINDLTDKHLLYQSSYKSKSVSLTPEGEKLAKQLLEKYLK